MLSEICSSFKANQPWPESKHDKHQAQIPFWQLKKFGMKSISFPVCKVQRTSTEASTRLDEIQIRKLIENVTISIFFMLFNAYF